MAAQEESTQRRAWLQGFAAIVSAPRQVVPLLGQQAGKVFVTALLLWTGAAVLSNWLYTTSSAVRHQLQELAQQRLEAYMAKHPELTAEQRQELRQRLQEGVHFSLTRSLLGGLFANVVALLSLLGLLWLVQPLVGVRWSVLRFGILVTALGYAGLWGAAGEVVAAALQVLGQSLRLQPSMAIFVDPEQQPLLFSVLSRIHLGAVVQFGMTGFLLGQAAALPLWRGLLWSYAAWALWLAAIYGMGALMV